jgi:hypothetical protein
VFPQVDPKTVLEVSSAFEDVFLSYAAEPLQSVHVVCNNDATNKNKKPAATTNMSCSKTSRSIFAMSLYYSMP